MTDWRGQSIQAQRRTNQISGDGASTGLFAAYIEASTGVTQSGTLVYSGGSRDISMPMPYDGNTSWIRVVPDSGSPALAGFRSDTQEPVFINYFNSNPKLKLDAYTAGTNLYRPLKPGEIELNSSGSAQSYYAARPLLEHSAGVVRSWVNQDRLEAGAKSPLHTRQLWEYKSAPLIPSLEAGTPILLGDEERLGVVRRPYSFLLDPATLAPRSGAAVSSAAAAASSEALSAASLALASVPPNTALAASLTQLAANLAQEATLSYSFNYFDYPYPNFTTAAGIISTATLTTTQAVAASAGAAASLAVGGFEPRVFAKEYVKIINNPLYKLGSNNPQVAASNPTLVAATATLLNPKLIDFREGQVFDDIGIQTLGPHGAYLRGSYKYYTPAGDATHITVDEVGNVDYRLSTLASTGWSVLVPTGGVVFNATSLIQMTCNVGNIDIIAVTGTVGVDALRDVSLSSGNEMSFLTGTNFSHTVTGGNYDLQILAGNYSASTSMNMSLVASTDFSATATSGSMTLTAPFVNMGATPNQSMILGDLLTSWLSTLTSALIAAAPIGNLGVPVLLNSDVVFNQTITTLQNQIEALKSATIKVSP